MEFAEVLASRRMVRAFRPDPVDPAVLRAVLDAARRGPAAGNAHAVDLVVLEGPEETACYWDTTLAEDDRSTFPWPDLPAAPVLAIVVTAPTAYVARYDEPDKRRTGLGEGVDAWPVPYWFVDAGAAVMAMLLAAVDAGLGALFFGVFEHEAAVKTALGIPTDRRIVGTLAIGHPGDDQRPSRSSARRRPAFDEVVHRGRW